MAKKILITGASGFIANSLLNELAQYSNYEVYATTRDSSNIKTLEKKFPGVNFFEVNLTNGIQLKKILDNIKPETIFHLAGKLFFNQGDSFKVRQESNIEPAITILSSVKELNLKPRVFLASTVLVYKDYQGQITEETSIQIPQGQEPYKLSKIEMEWAVKPYLSDPELEISILRLSNITGWGRQMSRVSTDFGQQIVLRKEGIIAPDAELLHFGLNKGIDILSVNDAARAIVSLDKVKETLAGQIINITSGESRRTGEIFEVMQEVSGIKEINIPFFEKTNPPYIFDNSKLKNLTGWQRRQSFEDVISEVYQYCLNLWHQLDPELRNEIFKHFIDEAQREGKLMTLQSNHKEQFPY